MQHSRCVRLFSFSFPFQNESAYIPLHGRRSRHNSDSNFHKSHIIWRSWQLNEKTSLRQSQKGANEHSEHPRGLDQALPVASLTINPLQNHSWRAF